METGLYDEVATDDNELTLICNYFEKHRSGLIQVRSPKLLVHL